MKSASAPKTPDYFSDLKVPSVGEMEVQLQQLVQQGVLSPEDAQAALVQNSQMNNVSTDPSLKKAQMDALAGLKGISDSGGLTDMDRANLNRIRTEENTASRGKQGAILQNAQSRGLGGSGLELLASLQNGQDSATRASQRDMDVAGQAQARALQALIQGGQTAGNIQAQDFGQKAQVAQAQDAIAKFNAQNQQNVNLTNTAAHNQAQAANLANSQNISNQNVGLSNQQQQYNKQLLQQNFQNEMAKRGGSAQIAQSNANAQFQANQGAANAHNQLIGAGIGAGAALGGAALGGPAGAAVAPKVVNLGAVNDTGRVYAKEGGLIGGPPSEGDSQPAMLQPGEMVIKKDDVPHMLKKMHSGPKGDFDVAGFLDTITGHKYGYKKGKKSV